MHRPGPVPFLKIPKNPKTPKGQNMPIAAHHMKPLPAGYVEAMKSWEGEKPVEEIKALADELHAKLIAKNPGYESAGNPRYESTRDGLDVLHYTIYVGVAPINTQA